MAFLTGAIDKKNLRRFEKLVKRSRIADLYQKSCKQQKYYFVHLRISMDPEETLEILTRYNSGPVSSARRAQKTGRQK
jgi:hypothetical protein